MQIAGKVVPLGKGEYDADATYNHLDWVRFEGSTWCCKKDNVKGVEPVEGDTWIMISEKGQTGASVNVVHDPKQGRTTSVHFINADTGEVLDTIDVLDGEDGAGNGDMKAEDYATKEPAKGIVDRAIELNDGSKKITIEDVEKKIGEPTAEGTNGQALMTDGNGNRFWGTVASEQLITSVADEFEVGTAGEDKGKLSLSSTVTDKLDVIDDSAEYLKSKNLVSNFYIGSVYGNSDGKIIDLANYFRTDFVKVGDYESYVVSNSIEADAVGVHCYSDAKDTAWLGRVFATDNVINADDFPSGTMYIGLNFVIADSTPTWVQVEGGSTPTAYVPYSKSNVELTKDVDYAYENGFVTRNLLSRVVQGSVNGTGGIQESSNTVISQDYVSVNPNTTYTVSAEYDGKVSIYEYASQGTSKIVSSAFTEFPLTITTTSTTKYLRVLFRKTDNSDLTPSDCVKPQLEKSETPTPYTPYAKSNVYLTQIIDSADIVHTFPYYSLNNQQTLEEMHNFIYSINKAMWLNINSKLCNLLTNGESTTTVLVQVKPFSSGVYDYVLFIPANGNIYLGRASRESLVYLYRCDGIRRQIDDTPVPYVKTNSTLTNDVNTLSRTKADAYVSLGEAASTITYELPEDGTYMFYVQTASSTSTSYNGFAMAKKNGGTVAVSKMSGLSSVSVTQSNGIVTIKNSSSSTTYKYDVVVQKVI